MKFMFTAAVAMMMMASFAHAGDKSGAQCSQELQQQAANYKNITLLANQKGGIPDLLTCKNISYNANGIKVDNKVYVTADRSSLIIQNNVDQSLSLTLIPGQIDDFAVMAGRLIISTADKKVLVVGRNGSVLEMLNSKGESYKTVKSISIQSDVLVMEQEGSGPIQLTEEKVTERVNDRNRFRAISF